MGPTLQKYIDSNVKLLYNTTIESDLAPSELCYPGDIPALYIPDKEESLVESVNPNEMDDIINDILSKPLINGTGLTFTLNHICQGNCNYLSTTAQAVVEKIAETYRYEYTHENYQDCPIIEYYDNLSESLSEIYEMLDMSDASNTLEDIDQKVSQSVLETFRDVSEETSPNFCANPYDIYNLCPLPVGERNVNRALWDVYKADTDEELTEAFLNLHRMSIACNEQYEVTLESNTITKKARAASRAVNKVEAKAIRNVGDTKNELAAAGKNAVDPMIKLLQQTYDKMKTKDENERKKIMLAGSTEQTALKAVRWVKRIVGVGIGAAIGAHVPVVAVVTAVTLIGQIASDKYFDKKVKNQIIRELEDEIEICNEKIDDSRGDEDKQKRYELIRIRNQLKHTKDKVQFGMKY